MLIDVCFKITTKIKSIANEKKVALTINKLHNFTSVFENLAYNIYCNHFGPQGNARQCKLTWIE